jgi:hypothetical protein
LQEEHGNARCKGGRRSSERASERARERERERERERQTDRERERQTERERETDRQTDRETHTEREESTDIAAQALPEDNATVPTADLQGRRQRAPLKSAHTPAIL